MFLAVFKAEFFIMPNKLSHLVLVNKKFFERIIAV